MNNKENTAVLEMLEEIKAQLSDINRSKETHNPQTQAIDLSGIEEQIDGIQNHMEKSFMDISGKIENLQGSPGNNELMQKIDYLTKQAGVFEEITEAELFPLAYRYPEIAFYTDLCM